MPVAEVFGQVMRGRPFPLVHGQSGKNLTPEYSAWKRARNRCNNPRNRAYKDYGGRGIKFLFLDFYAWLAELGPRPSPKLTVGRINNNGNYEPGNVRWETDLEQNRNRRPFKLSDDQVREIRSLCASGINQTEVASRFGVKPNTINQIVRGVTRKRVV